MVAQVGQQLTDLFGKGDIGDKVKNFDFSKMSTRDKTRDDGLHLNLAPAYGTLNRESMRAMDDRPKVMIAGTMRGLGKTPSEQRTWDNIIASFMQSPLLEPVSREDVFRADKLIEKSASDFKTDGSPNSAIVQKVKLWFEKLINDRDILESTQLNAEILGRVVAQTGAILESFETFFAKNEYHEKTIVDIGVLRFPDTSNPFFKVYRIQLKAWSDSRRTLFNQENTNGIIGEYNCRRYRPRTEIIDTMREEVRRKAVNEAENLFV